MVFDTSLTAGGYWPNPARALIFNEKKNKSKDFKAQTNPYPNSMTRIAQGKRKFNMESRVAANTH